MLRRGPETISRFTRVRSWAGASASRPISITGATSTLPPPKPGGLATVNPLTRKTLFCFDQVTPSTFTAVPAMALPSRSTARLSTWDGENQK